MDLDFEKSLYFISPTLIITAWAGKLTPQARVAVQTRTLMSPAANVFSTNSLKRQENNRFVMSRRF